MLLGMLQALSAAKFVSFVKGKGAFYPGLGVSPTSKVTEPEVRERRSKYPKGYSDRLLASSKKVRHNETR